MFQPSSLPACPLTIRSVSSYQKKSLLMGLVDSSGKDLRSLLYFLLLHRLRTTKDFHPYPFASPNTWQAAETLVFETVALFEPLRLVVQSRNPFSSPHLDYKPLSNSEDIQADPSRFRQTPAR